MKTGKKTHWLRNTLIVLIVCGIAGAVIAAVQFKNEGNLTYASANIQFSFDGAAQGEAPNGYPFDLKRITTDEVINEALTASSLTDAYTAGQIRENLKVTAVYPEDIVKRMTRYTSILDASEDQQATLANYQATIYNVVLYNTFDPSISADQLKTLLNNLLTAYRSDFARTGGPSLSRTEPIADLQDYDYTQQLTAISETAAQQSAYAQEMAEKAPDFRQDGKGFDDIVARYQYLEDDIDRLNAYITLNALSKDRERLQKQYEMEVRNLNRELASDQEELERIEAMVESYEKDSIIYVSTSGALQKVSSNASDTYDKLVEKRKELTDRITTINADIAKYQAMLDDMTANTGKKTAKTEETAAQSTAPAGTSETSEITEATGETVSTSVELTEEEVARMTEQVEQRLQDLTNKKSTIIADFASMLNAYTRREINEQTVSVSGLKYQAPSFFSTAFVVRVIKCAGPLCAVGLMVILVFLILNRRKMDLDKDARPEELQNQN